MQKTAYEMYSRDWSSDVCSSDLGLVWGDGQPFTAGDYRYGFLHRL